MTKKKTTKKKAAHAAVQVDTDNDTAVAIAEPTDATQVATIEGPYETADTAPATQKQKGRKSKGDITLSELAERYLANLEELGKSSGTCLSYRGELQLAIEWLGAETKLSEISVEQVQGFIECPAVTRTKSGRLKSPLSTAKTERVLRQALMFAAQKGWIEKAPLPVREAASAA
jgi:hypothetical protein